MPDNRLRLVMVLDWFFYYAASIANALAEEADILFITREHGRELGVQGPVGIEKRAALDRRVQLIMLRSRQSDLGQSINEVRWARAMVRAFRPDVVHEQPHNDWRLRCTAECVDVPHVLTVHDVTPHLAAHYRKNLVHRAVERQLFRSADAFIVHGRHQSDLAERQPWRRVAASVHVIPHGALAQPSAPSPLPEKPTLLFFGRVEFYKGLDVLVKAVRLLEPKLGVRVVVAGKGTDLERCRAFAGEAPQFEWRTGFVHDDDLPRLFAEASVVVLPYREASQSGVIPLAYANRRAVIASDVGSLADAVFDGRTGMLVPPEDPRALARAIERALGDRVALEAMSDAAHDIVTSGALSPAAIAAQHFAVYRELLRVDMA